MRNSKILAIGSIALLAFGLTACGGGEQEEASGESQPSMSAAGAELTIPNWMTVDNEAKTVTLEILAGQTDANNHWNFNGYVNGGATVTVPEGYTVTIEFENRDPAMAHSIGVDALTGNFPPMFDNPQPVFVGAISSNPTDAASATQPGQSETITFTASQAGSYSLVCYVPAHALSGMWIGFNVSSDGSVGVGTG
ncbi:MAG: sulfocyanin-like copper-binding protein [Gemmatimonadales bacterium]